MRGQVAIEFLVITVLALLLLIPIIAGVYSMSSESTYASNIGNAQNAINRIAKTVNLVHAQGPPAKARILVYIPRGVVNTSVNASEISMTLEQVGGVEPVWVVIKATVNGSLPTESGYHYVTIENMGDYVNVS